ncbi:AAEL003618-PA [Aedes aegypti]|uniref:Transporter n=1 Tax=Aedes aegypti TaxID=7159 RepID=Q17EZ3_AEDAE|nr:AAEL003618-PA [Aedes aegypti]
MEGHENNGFVGDSPSIPGQFRWSKTIDNGAAVHSNGSTNRRNSGSGDSVVTQTVSSSSTPSLDNGETEGAKERDQWGKGIEFLMSCIAMSVGLGNVWRFPFIALQNGGGAFVIPYIIVLLLVGKPVYYMEMIIGQFSSRGSVKVYDCAPAMRGVGYGQVLSIAIVSTYYASLMATTLKYLFESFQKILPWATCDDSWAGFCIPSGDASLQKPSNDTIASNVTSVVQMSSSAELYYKYKVLIYGTHGFIKHIKGVGFGQLFSVTSLITYYSSLMALIGRYMYESFKSPLPWANCRPEWGTECVDATATQLVSTEGNGTDVPKRISSSELYFK